MSRGVEQIRVVRVGIDHQSGLLAAQSGKVALFREEPVMAFIGFGVDFNDIAIVERGIQQIVHKCGEPRLGLDSGSIQSGIERDFIAVSDNVESPTR